MALWVEKHHGADGEQFIEQRIQTLDQAGEDGGASVWRQVADRYAQLKSPPVPVQGQFDTLN